MVPPARGSDRAHNRLVRLAPRIASDRTGRRAWIYRLNQGTFQAQSMPLSMDQQSASSIRPVDRGCPEPPSFAPSLSDGRGREPYPVRASISVGPVVSLLL